MSVRNPVRSFMAVTMLALAALAQTGEALAQAGRPVKGPALPFESDFAQRRKDKAVLQFNDHIAAVPANRIREVPTVNGRMGDRVVVGEGTLLNFPVGYLMTATYLFDKLRPKANAGTAASAADLEPNPDYALVRRFDAELGPVCAATEDKASRQRVEFRLKPGTKLMSLVLDQPGRWDAIAKDTSRSYALFTGIEERYVVNDPLARKLLSHCKSGAKDVTVAFDANSSINFPMMTGTDGSQSTPR
jgi:hypothetical protein